MFKRGLWVLGLVGVLSSGCVFDDGASPNPDEQRLEEAPLALHNEQDSSLSAGGEAEVDRAAEAEEDSSLQSDGDDEASAFPGGQPCREWCYDTLRSCTLSGIPYSTCKRGYDRCMARCNRSPRRGLAE